MILGNLDGIIICFWKSCTGIWPVICWLDIQRIRNILDNGFASPRSGDWFSSHALCIQTTDSIYA